MTWENNAPDDRRASRVSLARTRLNGILSQMEAQDQAAGSPQFWAVYVGSTDMNATSNKVFWKIWRTDDLSNHFESDDALMAFLGTVYGTKTLTVIPVPGAIDGYL